MVGSFARLLVLAVVVGVAVSASPAVSRACQPGHAPAHVEVLTTGGGLRPVLHLTGQLHARGVVTLHLRQVRACRRAGRCHGPALAFEGGGLGGLPSAVNAYLRPTAALIAGATYELSMTDQVGARTHREVLGRFKARAGATRPPATSWAGVTLASAERLDGCPAAVWAIALTLRDQGVHPDVTRARLLAVALAPPDPARPVASALAVVPTAASDVTVLLRDADVVGAAQPARLWVTLIDGDGDDSGPVELALP